MRRSSCCPDDPVRSADFRQISGNAQFHVPEGIGSDQQLPDPLPNGGYCHRSCELSVLARPCKYNIYKNIEGKADIPPFQCINSDVQK